jgi:hypothetical protein
MATTMLVETLDNFQHSTRLTPEGRTKFDTELQPREHKDKNYVPIKLNVRIIRFDRVSTMVYQV